MVIALCDKEGCHQTALGKAPWETPIGKIRKESFPVLKAIAKSGFPYPRLEMPGLEPDASGPDQIKIRQDPDYLRKKYPNMEYWLGCSIENKASNEYLEIKDQIQQNQLEYNKIISQRSITSDLEIMGDKNNSRIL